MSTVIQMPFGMRPSVGTRQVLLLRKDVAPRWYHELWPDVVAAATAHEDGVVLADQDLVDVPSITPPGWMAFYRRGDRLSLYFQNDKVADDYTRPFRVTH